MVVGCIPEWGNEILLCRRNIEPCRDKWTLPAGYLEMGETLADGAKRETKEEAGAVVTIIAPYALFDIPHIGQIYLFFRASMKDADFHPTPESSEVKLVAEEDIPWNELAFRVVIQTLRRYFADRKKGRFEFQTGVITPPKESLY
jgi:ADP-ribose pyrophosphatase YjhB (NUDIX family)